MKLNINAPEIKLIRATFEVFSIYMEDVTYHLVQKYGMTQDQAEHTFQTLNRKIAQQLKLRVLE